MSTNNTIWSCGCKRRWSESKCVRDWIANINSFILVICICPWHVWRCTRWCSCNNYRYHLTITHSRRIRIWILPGASKTNICCYNWWSSNVSSNCLRKSNLTNRIYWSWYQTWNWLTTCRWRWFIPITILKFTCSWVLPRLTWWYIRICW